MVEHATKRGKPRGKAAVKAAGARKSVQAGRQPTALPRGARIVVLTDDPNRRVVIVPGCHLDSLREEGDAFFFEDGNELVGMIVEGGTVEYDRDERAYIVRLADGAHSAG